MGSASAGARPARAVSQVHLPNANVFLIHSALGQAWADDTCATLMTGISWRTASIQMFGRRIPSPRLTAWVGDHAYTYSRLTWPPAPWGKTLRAIRQRVEELTGTTFNGALLNLYRDGYDSRKLSEGFSGYFSVHQDERLGGTVAYKTPKGSGDKPPPFAGTPLLTEEMDR